MLEGGSSFVCNLPYKVARKYNLMTQQRLEDILNDPNMTEESFEMEYNAQFYKLNNGAYIKPSDIIPNRTIIKAWYPPSCDKWIEEKDKRNKSWVIPRVSKQELRVLGVDIAFAKGKKNDATIIHYATSIPNKDKYMTEIPYSESLEGSNAKKIALRLKQLFYDGDCDYIVLDVAGKPIARLYRNIQQVSTKIGEG